MTLGRWPVRYFAFGESIDVPNGLMFESYDYFEDITLRDHPRMRRVVKPHKTLGIYYQLLHWSDDTDLVELDKKVIAGEATIEDFSGAVVAQPDSFTCGNCGTELRIAAVYGGEVLLNEYSAENARGHEYKPYCRVCNNRLWTLQIVEYLDEPFLTQDIQRLNEEAKSSEMQGLLNKLSLALETLIREKS